MAYEFVLQETHLIQMRRLSTVKPRKLQFRRHVLSGFAASLAMDVVQYSWASAFERNRPSGDEDEETEAIAWVVARLTRAAPGVFPEAAAPAIGRAIHYVFGVGFALAYGNLVAERAPTLARGAAFGTVLWLVSDRILIPAFKMGRPWSRYSLAERSNALASHLAYALVVEFTRLGSRAD